MPVPPGPLTPCLVGELSEYADPFTRGLAYLQQVRTLAPDSDLVNDIAPADRIAVCTWIGLQIDLVNAELRACLSACQDCFHDWERRSVQILAVPIRQSYGIDGICNLLTQPVTLLIDVGRVVPQDWLGLVAHEYAHAHVGLPGHGERFYSALSHLCLGLGLDSIPPLKADHWLCHWPPGRRHSDPIAFWRGASWPCALPMTEYYTRLGI